MGPHPRLHRQICAPRRKRHDAPPKAWAQTLGVASGADREAVALRRTVAPRVCEGAKGGERWNEERCGYEGRRMAHGPRGCYWVARGRFGAGNSAPGPWQQRSSWPACANVAKTRNMRQSARPIDNSTCASTRNRLSSVWPSQRYAVRLKWPSLRYRKWMHPPASA